MLILGLGSIVIGRPRPLYHALGAAPSTAVGDIVIIFKPTAPEQALRAALIQSGARLVDGPTVSDAYILYVKPSERPKALARLRADAAVVLAEPLDAEMRP
jgi:hypothetical protein